MEKKDKKYKARNMSGKVSILFIIVIIGIVGICFGVRSLFNLDNSITNDDTSSGEEVITNNKYNISYTDEEYVSSNSLGYVISTNKRNIVVIVNEDKQDVADEIVSSLTLISDDVWENNIKATALETTSNYDDVTNDMDMGVSYIISTGVVTNGRLSFITNMDGAFGGVSWNSENGYNYDSVNGAILTFENITNNYNGLYDAIYNGVVEYIENQEYVNDLESNWNELVGNDLGISGNWYFTTDGIKIIIPRYSIGPGFVGDIKVDISKDMVNDYLKDEYKIS